MKYKTLAELKAAYESGELNAKESPLNMAADSSVVYVRGEDGTWKNPVCVYEAAACEVQEESLTLLGIPWEIC